MAKTCYFCNKELGFLTPKVQFGDDYYVCENCLNKSGLTTKSNMDGITLAMVREWADDPSKREEYKKLHQEEVAALKLEKSEVAARNKRQKQLDAVDSWYRQHHINVGEYDEEEIRQYNAESMQAANDDIAGLKAYLTGSFLSGDSGDMWEAKMLHALMQQNWIIIRENEQIIELLKKIENKIE